MACKIVTLQLWLRIQSPVDNPIPSKDCKCNYKSTDPNTKSIDPNTAIRSPKLIHLQNLLGWFIVG